MKKFILFTVLSTMTVLITNGQVGLLSNNNKDSRSNVALTDSSFKLPSIEKGTTYLSDIKKPDTAVAVLISQTVEMNDRLQQLKNKLESNDAIIFNLQRQRETSQKTENELDLKNTENAALRTQILSLNKSLSTQRTNDSLLGSLIKISYLNVYNSFKNKFDSLVKLRNDFDKAVSKSNFLTRHYPIDTSKKIIDFERFTREMSVIYAELIYLEKQNALNISKIGISLEKLQLIKLPDPIINYVDASNELNKLWKDLALDSANLSEKLRDDTAQYGSAKKLYQTTLENYVKEIKKKENKDPAEFGAFPQLTSILGKRETIPQLQLYGSYSHENRSTSTEANLGLSFAPKAPPEETNLYSIFIPSASTFLINSNFTFGFWTNGLSSEGKDSLVKRLALHLGFNYAGKNILYDTAKSKVSINSSIFYTKVGVEFGVLPKRFSIYANINTATLFDKVDNFKAATNINSKFFGFIDWGAKFYLDPTPSAKLDDGLFIYLNTNFLINGGDVKRVTKSNDLVIPSIQVGMVKRLAKF